LLLGLLNICSIYTIHRAIPLRNIPEAFCWNGYDERTKLRSKFAVKSIAVFSSTFQVTPGDHMFVRWLVTFTLVFRSTSKWIFWQARSTCCSPQVNMSRFHNV